MSYYSTGFGIIPFLFAAIVFFFYLQDCIVRFVPLEQKVKREIKILKVKFFMDRKFLTDK